MSDTIKVVIEMSKKAYEFTKDARTARCFPSEYYVKMILNGTLLDDIKEPKNGERFSCPNCGFKADWYIPLKEYNTKESRGKSCSTCKNNDDEFSGECYECLKGIFDHYEAESEVDFPQPEDIEPTVKGFADTMDILDRLCEE